MKWKLSMELVDMWKRLLCDKLSLSACAVHFWVWYKPCLQCRYIQWKPTAVQVETTCQHILTIHSTTHNSATGFQ